MSVDEFFEGQAQSRELFDALVTSVNKISHAQIHVTKSQIAFIKGKAFAWVWMPGKYLHGKVAPLVLTLVFKHKDGSPRWKEVVEPSPGVFTHHLELYTIEDIDDQVSAWLREALLYRAKPLE